MLKVIGAGFGRTGTHSLSAALETLGFGPCYTLLDINKNIDHYSLWQQALDGQSINWKSLFQNYRAAVEWPTISFLPQILHQFPKAKVILTLREPNSWYESASSTIFPGLEASAKHPDPEIRTRSNLKRRLILEHVFSGNYWDKSHAIHVYQSHIRQVEQLVPPHQLLKYEVSEGWLPLCSFLAVSEPNEPFPRKNDRSSFLSSAPDWAVKVMNENKEKRDSAQHSDDP